MSVDTKENNHFRLTAAQLDWIVKNIPKELLEEPEKQKKYVTVTLPIEEEIMHAIRFKAESWNTTPEKIICDMLNDKMNMPREMCCTRSEVMNRILSSKKENFQPIHLEKIFERNRSWIMGLIYGGRLKCKINRVNRKCKYEITKQNLIDCVNANADIFPAEKQKMFSFFLD